MNKITGKQKTVSIFLKMIVFVSAVTGTALSAYAAKDRFMGGRTTFMFFTTQSNIAMALISVIGICILCTAGKTGRVWSVIKFVGTISITLTGIVFGFVLAPALGVGAWNVQNTLTHLVVPVLSVVDFFVVGNVLDLKKKDVCYVLIPPVLYAVYAGIGYVLGWQFVEGYNYPYFFLNWGSPAGAFGFTKGLPFMGTGWWILALLIFLLAVGSCYLAVNDRIHRKSRRSVS
ncbi:MAG: Pr6Pr family membrane protein [Lachnospiraceae bacterium]|nr:Pr6Pr family membrane protein [Lachnospiraceae bacterium]